MTLQICLKMPHAPVAPSARYTQVSETTKPGRHRKMFDVAELLNVDFCVGADVAALTHSALTGNVKHWKRSYFTCAWHLRCVSFGEEASEKAAGTIGRARPKTKRGFARRWNFLQITEVKQAGPDKEEKNKWLPDCTNLQH